jgi:hypothetical protein
LFDPAYVPADVVSPASVAEVNAVVQRLRERLVDRVEFQEPVSRFRVSNMARVYNQSHLRRCLQLIEAAHHLVYAGQGLAALMIIRSLYETVANYVAVSKQLVDLIEATAPLEQIHDFIHSRTFATRSEQLIKIAGTDEVKAPNILTQVQKMNRLRGDFDVFASRGHDPKEDLHWVLVGGHTLTHFADAIDRLEAVLPGLSERGRREAPPTPAGGW